METGLDTPVQSSRDDRKNQMSHSYHQDVPDVSIRIFLMSFKGFTVFLLFFISLY